MWSYWKLHKYPILIVIGSILLYAGFAYDLRREDFIKLITLVAALFILLIKLIQFEKWNTKLLLAAGLLFRLVFLLAEPNLSQDFYRFIWDGELIKNGINPYLFTPDHLIESGEIAIANARELHEGMGELSARNFSNYPPFNQVFFALAALFGGNNILGSVVVMRLFIIAADVGTLYFGRNLLLKLNKSNHLIFWYFLNPLVIIELTGNLHFEGIMIFFFVWAMFLATNTKWTWAAPIYALSILLKLIPLLFLPLFLKFIGLKKSLLFYLLIGIASLLLLWPFYSDSFIGNYSQTVGLWFSNFEFNAGIYNAVKKIAVLHFETKPWELVKTYGSYIPLATLLMAFIVTLIGK
ncbi:MAG: mannosyltransferase, partial [Croceitalea sp.]|nr:mannosyltransferase [Croceitalea sp.]